LTFGTGKKDFARVFTVFCVNVPVSSSIVAIPDAKPRYLVVMIGNFVIVLHFETSGHSWAENKQSIPSVQKIEERHIATFWSIWQRIF
jgi:hypothetical protein